MENLNLREHIDYVIQCTKELGLSQSTVEHYIRHYEAVFLHCTKKGMDVFMYQDAADFCRLKYGADSKSLRLKVPEKPLIRLPDILRPGNSAGMPSLS